MSSDAVDIFVSGGVEIIVEVVSVGVDMFFKEF